MPRGAGKGGKTRKKTKNQDFARRALTQKEDGQEYALVSKMLGSSRIECLCADQKKRLCLIRGKMKNRVWIKVGDLVLVSLRDFEPDKGDVILKYSPEEYKDLKKMGALPDTLKMDVEAQNDSDDEVEFQDSGARDNQKAGVLPDSDDEEEKKEEVDIDAI